MSDGKSTGQETLMERMARIAVNRKEDLARGDNPPAAKLGAAESGDDDDEDEGWFDEHQHQQQQQAQLQLTAHGNSSVHDGDGGNGGGGMPPLVGHEPRRRRRRRRRQQRTQAARDASRHLGLRITQAESADDLRREHERALTAAVAEKEDERRERQRAALCAPAVLLQALARGFLCRRRVAPLLRKAFLEQLHFHVDLGSALAGARQRWHEAKGGAAGGGAAGSTKRGSGNAGVTAMPPPGTPLTAIGLGAARGGRRRARRVRRTAKAAARGAANPKEQRGGAPRLLPPLLLPPSSSIGSFYLLAATDAPAAEPWV